MGGVCVCVCVCVCVSSMENSTNYDGFKISNSILSCFRAVSVRF